MSVRKLPSGSYQVYKIINGNRYAITLDHKPSKHEIEEIEGSFHSQEPTRDRMTMEQAINKYIEMRRSVVSPGTVIGYKSTLRNLSDEFKALNIYKLTPADVQVEINQYSVGRSPKTVRNAHGLISSVCHVYVPRLLLNTTLPQKIKHDDYIPSEDDVKRILEYSKGHRYEVPLWLAAMGLRRSELIALEESDLDGNVLTINKAKVKTDSGQYVLKTTKTTASSRQVCLPDQLVALIHERGLSYDYHPHNINRYLHKVQKELGIPEFSLHKMRHYFASRMSQLTDDATVMALGGWSSDYVLKSVYRHSLNADDLRKKTALSNEMFKNF